MHVDCPQKSKGVKLYTNELTPIMAEMVDAQFCEGAIRIEQGVKNVHLKCVTLSLIKDNGHYW